MSIPHKCPVCGGRGTVPPGFYDVAPGGQFSTSSFSRETCRACFGRGILWAIEWPPTEPAAEKAAPPPWWPYGTTVEHGHINFPASVGTWR